MPDNDIFIKMGYHLQEDHPLEESVIQMFTCHSFQLVFNHSNALRFGYCCYHKGANEAGNEKEI